MKNVRMNFRLNPLQDRLIRRAADVTRKSVSEFILESACLAAENAILDQRLFFLNEKNWNEFQEALQRPAVENPRLKRLLEENSPWD